MFVTDRLVYVQLQKTGSTHIARLLSEVTDGEYVGRKHQAPTPELLESGRAVVSSIRDPWNWYASLWRFGCLGKGGIENRTAHNGKRGERWHWPGVRGLRWRMLYRDPQNPRLFRAWLRRMHSPRRAGDLGPYGDTTIPEVAGLYTYRYLRLTCGAWDRLSDGSLRSTQDLLEHARNNSYVHHWIRNERLEEDLLDAMDAVGEPITDEGREKIRSTERTNISSRPRPRDWYYDDETMALIRHRESLIVARHGYRSQG